MSNQVPPQPADPSASSAAVSPQELRRQKGLGWRTFGFEPYGNDTGPIDPIAKVRAANTPAVDPANAERIYRVAGRVMNIREAGKLQFHDLRDGSGEVQLFISQRNLEPRVWDALKLIDRGDIVLAEGRAMYSKRGEFSIEVRNVRPLTKALLEPAKVDPDRVHEVGDVEDRYRQRYRDLIDNPARVADVFRARATAVAAVREFFDARDFMEVETPVLQLVRGGATARPFRTHHNALDLDMYLRIAPELYLKRLLVGGFERVYELARCFRNEGISTRHNPEFTMLEFYQAYATYDDLMTETEALFEHVDARVLARFPRFGEGRSFSLARPFRRVPMRDAVRDSLAKRAPELLAHWSLLGGAGDWRALQTAITADRACVQLSGDERSYVRKVQSAGELLFALFEVFAEKHLVEDYRTADGSQSVPVFVTDYPFDVSPLARRKNADAQRAQYGEIELDLVDRFEFFVDGRELCNAFSELNDPDDQAARFQAQLANRARGDEEAMDYDADYVRALTHGMPPAAGFGMGIDRFVMALTGARSIRDVILFPLLRPEAPPASDGST